MEALFLALMGITALFFLFLGIKEIFSKKIKSRFCVICISISVTWIVLLILYFNNLFFDKTILAILMGQTSLGLFYFFYEKMDIFKLPFLLALIATIYFVLEKFSIKAIYFLVVLWIFLLAIHLFKKNKNFRTFANKLVGCCKKW